MKNNRAFTTEELFQRHAPDFNFELNGNQLVKKALELGYIRHCGFRLPGGAIFKYAKDGNEKIK